MKLNLLFLKHFSDIFMHVSWILAFIILCYSVMLYNVTMPTESIIQYYKDKDYHKDYSLIESL